MILEKKFFILDAGMRQHDEFNFVRAPSPDYFCSSSQASASSAAMQPLPAEVIAWR
jgi:hypothetical protein